MSYGKEVRPWGYFDNLHEFSTEDRLYTKVKYLEIEAGKNMGYQKHNHRSELWFIAQGNGIFVLNDQLMEIHVGMYLVIPQESWHAILANSMLKIVEVQFGTEFEEDEDYIGWNEIMQNVKNLTNQG